MTRVAHLHSHKVTFFFVCRHLPRRKAKRTEEIQTSFNLTHKISSLIACFLSWSVFESNSSQSAVKSYTESSSG